MRVRGYGVLTAISLLLVAGTLLPKAARANSQEALREALAENERERRLPEYRDNETTLRLKLDVLEVINANRARHGLSPLRLDILACRVASRSASEALKDGYHGHWNLRGEKPYHRWAFAGGLDHAMENASVMRSSAPISKDYKTVRGFITDIHMRMYNEAPPNDGHRQNILNPWHTHVGLGFSLAEGDFRYYELYLDRYLEFDAPAQEMKAGDEVTLSGRVIKPGYGVFFAIVYHEPFPSSMTVSEVNARGSYPDFTSSVLVNIPYWKIRYDDATKRFSLSFSLARAGLYYVHIYVKKGHTGAEAPAAMSTAGLVPVSGIVIKAQ